MARLFIFAIGGTGSRVLKSLTMLLAAGVKPLTAQSYELVPIIIDPHKSNDDLKRTVKIMETYQAITATVGTQAGFFSTRLTTLDKLGATSSRLSTSFTLSLQKVATKRFRDYIEFGQLDESNRALADILFSGKSINKHGEETSLLDIEMDIGFVGNPNIGSVVLNQFKDSDEFREIASQYDPADRIFIISSIFGGTGAAGFPTILKNVRNAMNNTRLNSKGLLENSKIGAVTVLPYFNLENSDNSPIHKSDFIGKTKAALYYYMENVNPSVNTMYYINDDFTGSPYKNDPGDNGQQNNAHFVELAAALAIFDFLEIPDQELESRDGKAVNPICKEFGIRHDSAKIKFGDLQDGTEKKIALPLAQLALFRKYLNEKLVHSLGKEPWSMAVPVINGRFTEDTFFRSYIRDFMAFYGDWLTELEQNNRGFAPFSLASPIESMIHGHTIEKSFFSSKTDMGTFDSTLSKISKNKTYSSAEEKLVSLFYDGSKELLTSKFGF